MSCIVVCDLETSRRRRPWSVLGCSATGGTVRDICNENILLMNKRNVGTKTVLNEIQNF